MKRRSALPPLTRRVRAALRRVADPARAPAMRAYMKSAMPYLGVPAPAVRAVCREVFGSYSFDGAEEWRADVLELWRSAQYREERYAAIALSSHRKAEKFQNLDALPMYEEMIVTGAWWDYVDTLAAHQVGGRLAAHPREMRRAMLSYSRSPNLWKRRTAILCQLLFGESTDVTLLYACIEPSLSSKEFFLQKAIGWALRQVAKYDPDEVVRYVAEHESELSPLSRREALKNTAGRRPRPPRHAAVSRLRSARRKPNDGRKTRAG